MEITANPHASDLFAQQEAEEVSRNLGALHRSKEAPMLCSTGPDRMAEYPPRSPLGRREDPLLGVADSEILQIFKHKMAFEIQVKEEVEGLRRIPAEKEGPVLLLSLGLRFQVTHCSVNWLREFLYFLFEFVLKASLIDDTSSLDSLILSLCYLRVANQE